MSLCRLTCFPLYHFMTLQCSLDITEEEGMFAFSFHRCFSVGPTIGVWEIKIFLLVTLSPACFLRASDVSSRLWHPEHPQAFLITLLRDSTETALKLSPIYSPNMGSNNTAS